LSCATRSVVDEQSERRAFPGAIFLEIKPGAFHAHVAAILSGVIAETTLRGYLLEETLAWLLRDSAYELLTARDSDPELVTQGAELRVRGRGATHQVDVLGQFAFTPAFSVTG
jgi:hypothetical protein